MQEDKDDDNDFLKYLLSEEFKQSTRKAIEDATWGIGQPMIYRNEKGEIVKHYKDGKIEIAHRYKK